MRKLSETTGQFIFCAVNIVHLVGLLCIFNMESKRLPENIRIHQHDGSGTNKTAHQMAGESVPDDVFKCFAHLPRLKSVKPYVDGFSICTFESKMNSENQ